MKKSIFLFFAALLFSASAWAGWCGNSFITVNGLWCTGSNSYVHEGGNFHGKDLGTLTTLELGGEFQVWPSSTTAGTLCYKIDDGTENSISLPKEGDEGNNSKHSGSGAVDLSGLAEGNHTIAVWFKHGSDIDNNGGSNFVATFTIAAAGEEPEPVADVTVHFINSVEWAAVACHHWIPGGAGTSWPGEVLSKTDEIAGYDVYTATFTGAHTSCIFNNNNNGQQTDDLTVENGKYYEANTKTWYADKAAAEAALATPIPDETVYLINTGNWSKVMIHTWNGVGGTAWPGVEMTPTGETIEGYAVYSYTAKQGGQANLLFQESADVNKTGDLEWQAGKYYAPLKNEWYETKEAAAEALAAPVEYEYVYLINTNDWAAANIYTWTPEVAGWPGAAMTLEAEQIAGKDVYSYKVVKGTTFGGLNFNCGGDECKTGDLTWEAGKYYAPSTGEWYADAAAAEAALAAVVIYDYYIAGTENLTGYNWKENGLGMTKEGDVYKHTFSEMNAGTYEFKITDGTWTNPWGFSNLAANYVGVEQGKDGEGNYNGNIKIVTEEAKNIIVIFDPANNEITLEGWEEAAPAEPVTVYFINSGEWAEVACHYWGGLNGSTWPGAQMTANGEVFEAEGWNVYKVTFPGDNTSCIFNNNKAEGATQTGNLEVHDGQYYCYENGIWYELLADVDPLDTRVYLKGQMNEWCNNGYCDMFRKEDMSETVAYRTTWLDANTPYEFKIESAGTWLSCAQAVTKDNCTDLTFEEGGNNCTITTEYAGEYLFIWDMTTNKLSVVYPDPKANPTVLDLMVTDMEFDGDKTFSGSNNMYSYSIAFNLVLGEEIGEGVFALDASSTVDFGGTPFTEVTGEIAPDMSMGMPTAATAVVYGFFEGMYFQLNVQMSAGGSAATPVVIWDGVATPNDVTGELTISANWEGDDVYVVVPGFNNESFECDEVWFYIGGTTWETASIAAYGPATITVEDGGVLVEGTVISGITGTQYELMVFGLLPVEETPDYTRAVASGSYGTICLPNGSSKVEGAKFYEVTYKKDGHIYADEVTTLVAGMPYIFQATSTEIKVYYNETPAAANAGSNNGVYGTFSDITDGDAGTAGNILEGKYLLVAGPKVQKCGGNCSLAANRAYFVVSEITTNETQPLPGRKRIALGCQEENQATGLDNITENGIVAPAMQGTYDILGRQLSEPAANGFYIINGKKMFVVK